MEIHQYRSGMTIYKSTVLPIIGYADFVHDQNIIYINKKLHTIQNQYLYIVFNQHMLPYLGRQSSDMLHREARLFRLDHRRHMHLLGYVYLLTHVDDLMDNRDINTRQHEGKMFLIPKTNHSRCEQDPHYRAIVAWNQLPIRTRNVTTKIQLTVSLKTIIVDQYEKLY